MFSAAKNIATQSSKGWNILHSKKDVDIILTEMRRCDKSKAFWNDNPVAAEFIHKVLTTKPPQRFEGKHHVIVVEGLDGVGKTTVTSNLADRLGGTLVRTPDPSLEPVRAVFRVLDESLARTFYCAANYMAACSINEIAQTQPVVVDRWWASTCSMALASSRSMKEIPPQDSAVWKWPSDLPQFSLGIVLNVPEDIRLKRIAKRGDENAEEAELAEKEEMRKVAGESYRRMQLYSPIAVPNYCFAINDIADLMHQRGLLNAEELAKLKYSKEECDETACY